jgi:predicted nucleic acid-binding protein
VKHLVLDTSVAIAWYLPAEFSPTAREWQRRMLDERVALAVPSFHFWEVANVLRTYVRRRELEAALAREIYALHLDAPLEVIDPDRAVVLDTALRFDTTAYDAVFVALALERDFKLLCAEKTTRPWITKLGDRVESVR